MGRPLTGTVKPFGTKFRASCPTERGSRKRVEATFATEQAAQTWRTSALATLAAGGTVTLPSRQERALPVDTARTVRRPLPAPRAAHPVATTTSPVDTSFATNAEAWVTERYTTGWKGGAEREIAMRAIVSAIDTDLFREGLTLQNVTRPAIQAFLVSLARAPEPTGAARLPQGLDPATEVTFDEAVLLPQMPSLSSLKRRVKDGSLPSRLADGRRLMTVADLYSTTAGLLGAPDATGAPGELRRGPRREVGYSNGVVHTYVQVLRNVWKYAAAVGVPVNEKLLDDITIPVSDRPRSAPRKPVDLATCAAVAGGLHPVHQVALWLMRILGLRISEAYGILVGDVIDHGADKPGVIAIRAQGGKTTVRRDRRTGTFQSVDRVEETKTLASDRLLLVPPAMMVLLRVTIAAFHTDPASGEVDNDARLVPGLAQHGTGGQSALRTALKRAAAELSVGHADDVDATFSIQPHDLRKSQLSHLARKHVEQLWRRRFGGHAAGHAVAERTYVLDDPELRPMLELTAVIEEEITTELPGGLLVPTAQRCTTGSQPALATRADDIDATLIDAGWLVPAHDGSMPMLDAAAIALELDCEVQAARRYLREGQIPSVVAAQLARGEQRVARWDDVQAVKRSREGWTTASELAVVVGKSLRVVTDQLRRAEVDSEVCGGVRLLAPDAARAVIAHFQALAQLAERSMSIAAARSELGVTLLVVHHLIEQGTLIEDARNAAGARTVTRESVAAHAATRRPRVRGHWDRWA